MSVRTDTINLNVNINGDDARNKLNQLKKNAADIRYELQGLKKGTQEYIDKSRELKQVEADMASLKKQIGITSLTQKELVAELNKLKALKGSVEPFSKEFKDLEAQIKKVENRLYDVRNGVQGFSSFMSKISDEVKQFGLMAAAYLGFEFLTNQFRNIIQGAGKLSDQLADIRRVTHMTDEEVQKLNKSLTGLDTRTSTGGLREIAVVAGRLGVAKEDILGFVAATDKLVVALGDELGDADQITTQLGKIIGVFDKGDKKVTGEKLTLIGNAIVDLANKGVASGGFIVDFTQRLAGLADTADLSLPAVMGLGAGLEESGQKAESSSTAIIKVLGQIGKDVPKFAAIAGKSIEEFSKTLREKPVEAIIQVSEGLTKGKKGFEDISKAFADAGEDGAKIISTLGVIGGRADFFRQKISDAGTAMKDTNEINEAFELKNQTLGATLDKLGKEFNKLFASSSVSGFLKGAVDGTMSFIKGLRELPQWMDRNSLALKVLTLGIVTMNAEYIRSAILIARDTIAKTYNSLVTKGTAIATTLATAAQASYIVVTNLLTGSITAATAAQRLWNIVTKAAAGPIGMLIILVGTLIIALNQQSAAAKLAADINKRIADATTDEVNKVKTLASVISDGNVSLDNRKKALAALIAINPQYLSGLTLENIATSEGKKILDGYIKSLLQKAEIEAKQAVLIDKLKERNAAFANLRSSNSKVKFSSDEDLTKQVGRSGDNSMDANKAELMTAAMNGDVDLAKLKTTLKEIEVLQADVSTAAKKNVDLFASSTSGVAGEAGKSIEGIIEKLKAKIKTLEDALPKLTTMKAINVNLAETAKLQAELDAILGKKTKGDHEYDKLLAEAKAFQKELEKLKFQAEEASKSQDQKEIDAARHKYEEILKHYDALVVKLNRKDRSLLGPRSAISDAEEQELQAILDKQNAAHFAKQQKEKQELLKKSYSETQQETERFYEEEKNRESKRFVDSEISKTVYEANIAHIDVESKAAQLFNAEKFAGASVIIEGKHVIAVDAAAKDITKLKKEQLDKQTADAIKNYEAQQAELELRETLYRKGKESGFKVAVTVAKNSGDYEGEKQAQQTFLKWQHDERLRALDREKQEALKKITSSGAERIAAEAEINDSINKQKAEADLEYDVQLQDLEQLQLQRKIDHVQQIADATKQIFGSLNTFLTNMENRELQNEITRNNKRRGDYKKLLDTKLISQAQYAKQIQAIDDQEDKRKKEVAREQAKRQKALNIFEAVMNTASAVVAALTAKPFGPWNFVQAALVGAIGAANVGAIISTPLPELGKGDWVRDGDKHSDRSGGINAKIERDEAVMSAAAMTDPETYTVTGTTAQITSALNAKNNGTAWAGGAVIEMTNWLKNKPASINPNMPRIMAQGGLVVPLNQQQKENVPDNGNAALIAEFRALREDVRNWPRTVKGLWVIRDLEDAKRLDDAAKKASGLNS